ncbi:MAG TPA: hypothetical protein VLM37_09135, partial [Fibrobacteraceae bacterium]|nr:hypothetical protein [Fibrobacteraceae bacterium]
MKNLIPVLALSLPVAAVASSLTLSAGSIAADSTWNADTVLVGGSIVVEAGHTLNISAGTQVLFSGAYSIHVSGRLVASGTAT